MAERPGLFAAGSGAERGAHGLGQGHEAAVGAAGGGLGAFCAAGELAHAVLDPDGEGLAARRAAVAQRLGLFGRQADAAGAVAVQVVLALFGEKFYRAQEPNASGKGGLQAGVA